MWDAGRKGGGQRGKLTAVTMETAVTQTFVTLLARRSITAKRETPVCRRRRREERKSLKCKNNNLQ